MLTSDNFYNVAQKASKIAWTDEELLEAIQVHQCLVAYFRARSEPIITFALRMDLESLENFARARKWECSKDTWEIRR